MEERILIVEDDPASQNILLRLLEAQGYSVVTANNGHEAMAAASKEKPKLALVDVVLPEVNGMDFLRWIRINHPKTKVIILSVLESNSPAAQEAKDMGVFDYFRKPPNFQDLLARIEEAMR